MRKLLGGLFILGLLLLAALPIWAQDETPMPDLTPTFVPTSGADNPSLPLPPYQTFYEAIRETNMCSEDLFEAARSLLSPEDLALVEQYSINNMLWMWLPAGSVIPPHEDCYEKILVNQPEDMPQIEHERNICIEEYYPLMMGYADEKVSSLEIYLRKDAPPCVNEQGQRLTYFDADGKFLETPVYSPVPLIDVPKSLDLAEWGYCMGDLKRANPAIFGYRINNLGGAQPGMRLFLPSDVRRCDFLTPPEGKTLYEISQQLNICMETLLEMTDIQLYADIWILPDLSVPVDAVPCYDAKGQRLNANDREAYKPQMGESFLDIARAYHVCLDALWDANPVMARWGGWVYMLPSVVFIPDVPPCEGDTTYTTRENQTFHTLSLLTNVCINRIADANPSLSSAWLDTLPQGEVLTIPQRPHCYDLSDFTSSPRMQPYVCYAEPITAESDFTGHEPAVTASADTDLPYCYPRHDDMTIIYNNKPYSLYKTRGYETLIIMSQCFGVPIESMYEVNIRQVPWEIKPARGGSTIYALIPQPHEDCPLLGVDDTKHRQIYTQMTYQAGSLRDGVYTVNYNDTLSSIGHTYGYLPQSIADTNGLENPNTVYYLQELRLPCYPSLYTLAPVGGAGGVIVLASAAIYGLRRWSRSRGKGKKKNSEQ